MNGEYRCLATGERHLRGPGIPEANSGAVQLLSDYLIPARLLAGEAVPLARHSVRVSLSFACCTDMSRLPLS